MIEIVYSSAVRCDVDRRRAVVVEVVDDTSYLQLYSNQWRTISFANDAHITTTGDVIVGDWLNKTTSDAQHATADKMKLQ